MDLNARTGKIQEIDDRFSVFIIKMHQKK